MNASLLSSYAEYALLQVVNGHVLKVDLLGTIDVCSICENADGHARTRDVGKPVRRYLGVGYGCMQCLGLEDALDCSRETFVTLGVVVLETDLELDGLNEVALLLAVGIGKELLDRAPHA